MRDDVVVRQSSPIEYIYRVPFEFEMELCPTANEFLRSTMRFGHKRQFADKPWVASTSDLLKYPLDKDWAFVLRRTKH
jgi:hypothetical protein